MKKKLINRKHRLNVERFRSSLLLQDLNALMNLALDGYDYLFTRSNRELLIHLAGEKDESRRVALATSIAQDAAERFSAMDRGERLPSVMSDADKAWLHNLKEEIRKGRVFREQLAEIRDEVGSETYETAKKTMKRYGYDLP
ncbi:MAG TPA: hypothetical protein VE422_02135 [Terriglobia bacterium]|nr:hypothetical protein [Terriglobia bacterium]